MINTDLITYPYPYKDNKDNVKKIIKKIKNYIFIKYPRFKIQYNRRNYTPTKKPKQYRNNRLNYFLYLELKFNHKLQTSYKFIFK